MNIEPFKIELEDEVLTDLRDRISNTKWPEKAPETSWKQGTDIKYLKQILSYWEHEFNWREQEKKLNTFNHFRTKLDGINIHFVYEQAKNGDGIPLILTNGWPSSFLELLPLIPFLTDPQSHNIDGPSFDVIIPSLPGFAFSERPFRNDITLQYTAGIWNELMNILGYDLYGTQGGDFGAGVATYMALDKPEAVSGLHLSNLEVSPRIGKKSRSLSKAEKKFLKKRKEWYKREGGYKAIQSTKPQTLGYGLNDSPAGLAAWILEKWKSWSDCKRDLNKHFSIDFLLTNLTIYWATETITSSIRMYYDNRCFNGSKLEEDDFIEVPTAIAVFSDPAGNPPKEWAERLYNIQRWTVMPRGGHFAPAEEPKLFAKDISNFFYDL